MPYQIQPDNIILDIQRDTVINSQTIEAIIKLKNSGFTLAIEDIHDRPNLLPLLPHIDILRLNIKQISNKDLKIRQKILEKFKLKLLAEKVETLDEYENYMNRALNISRVISSADPELSKAKHLKPTSFLS